MAQPTAHPASPHRTTSTEPLTVAQRIAEIEAAPLTALDPSDAALFESDAHLALFRRLRREAPVHRCAESPFGPYWSVTTHAPIMEVDTAHSVFSSQDDILIGDQPRETLKPMFIAMDPPEHTHQRQAAMPGVAPGRLDALEAQIRAHAREILDGLPDGGAAFDWVEAVSKELTARMLATLFAVPFEDRHKLIHWSDISATSEQTGVDVDMDAREQELLECLRYFATRWAERAAQPPAADFISLLAHNPRTKGMIDRPMELLGNLMLLIVGGNDTTRNSISGGVFALDRNPAEFAKLVADPGLIPGMVSEIIRWQTPLAHMRRTALSDYELGGQTIRKGDKVVMWYVSGNRDEAMFEDAERFWIDRPNARRHVAFGFGIHRCMGNRVAEMQLRVLWEEILARFRQLEVVGEPLRVHSNFVRGYERLMVRAHRR